MASLEPTIQPREGVNFKGKRAQRFIREYVLSVLGSEIEKLLKEEDVLGRSSLEPWLYEVSARHRGHKSLSIASSGWMGDWVESTGRKQERSDSTAQGKVVVIVVDRSVKHAKFKPSIIVKHTDS